MGMKYLLKHDRLRYLLLSDKHSGKKCDSSMVDGSTPLPERSRILDLHFIYLPVDVQYSWQCARIASALLLVVESSTTDFVLDTFGNVSTLASISMNVTDVMDRR